LNVLSIPVLVGVMGIKVVAPETFRFLVPVVGAVMFLVNYLLLYRGERYRSIAREFADDKEATRRFRTIAVWVYITASVAAFYGALMLGTMNR
jgi:hypothetical protein